MTVLVAALMGVTLGAPGIAVDPLPNIPQAPPSPEPVVVVAEPTPYYGTSDGCAIPCSVMECESGGNYAAENSVSTASGAYQIVDGTWNGFGGYSHASDAPPSVQDAKARELWAGGAGASHWAACL